MTKEQLLNAIEKACEPGKMSKSQALEFLEELSNDIECRMDCLRDEMKAESAGEFDAGGD